jgi:tetratricopeptide (TPR) repeat protein
MKLASELVQAEIDQLCAQGDAHVDQQHYADALALYWSAWDLLPEPKLAHDAATWILAAVGDANFLGHDYEAGCDNLATVMHCPGGIDIAFLHMRLGQCQYELGDHAHAYEELSLACACGGAALFDDEDPKYLAFVDTFEPDPATRKKSWLFWR